MGVYGRLEVAAQDVVLEAIKDKQPLGNMSIDDMTFYARRVWPTARIEWQNKLAARALDLSKGDLSEILVPATRKIRAYPSPSRRRA
ncbi:hypothetical protein [Vineibacter terrae]|uniref:hypothetical protein n=1 Tax=Vineibacter terrae TaxID=2586908 RepID=UPI002E3013EA|nr:hypothetical protein [Vineibacter terrae]HEX2891602.1 hypothetical protein [Vineibacter terrae]